MKFEKHDWVRMLINGTWTGPFIVKEVIPYIGYILLDSNDKQVKVDPISENDVIPWLPVPANNKNVTQSIDNFLNPPPPPPIRLKRAEPETNNESPAK